MTTASPTAGQVRPAPEVCREQLIAAAQRRTFTRDETADLLTSSILLFVEERAS